MHRFTNMVDWCTMPLVRIALFFSAGILIARWAGDRIYPFNVLAVGVALCVFAVLHLQRTSFARRAGTYVLLFISAAIGCLFYSLHDETQSDLFIGDARPQSLVIRVSQQPVQTSRGYKVAAQIIVADGRPAKGGVWAYFNTDARLAPGSLIDCSGTLRRITNAGKSDFDYSAFCRNKHITHQLFISEWAINRLPSSINPAYWADRIYLTVRSVLEGNIPAGPELSVGKALLLGDKSGLDRNVSSQYRDAGAAHILVVSGMHLGILWLGLSRLLNLLPFKSNLWNWCRWLIMVSVLWLAALVAGAGGSVVRAATMFTFLSFGKSCSFNTNAINILAASALALLMYDSFLLFDVGFLLSYAAVLGILVFYPLIYKLIFCKEWLLDKAWQLTAVGLAAQLGTLPITLTVFGTFPVYFFVSGITAVPLSSVALLSGMGLLIADVVGLGTTVFGYVFYSSLWAMNASIELIQHMPGHVVNGCFIHVWQAVLLTICICVFGIALQHRHLRLWNITLFLLVLWLGSFYVS